VLAPQQAHALVATTQYVPFKIFQNSANNIPLNLNFQSFSSLIAPSPNINLTGIGFKIAGAADGTGTAAHFRVYNSQATKDGTTCFIQGTVGTSATDMIVDSVSFTAGQQFQVTAFTLTDGNS
jgi:hypothetical protein